MEVLELWEKFVTMHPEAKDSTYEVWAFGSNPSMDDRSLTQWRYAHLNYFQEVFHTYGLTFTEKEILYCETFRVCYRV